MKISKLTSKNNQRGMSMLIVLGLMSVVFVVSAISVRITMLAERSARNDRDRQIAFQNAEAALGDAELDIMGPNSAANRRCVITSKETKGYFVPGCGTDSTDKTRGFCAPRAKDESSLHTDINFEETNDANRRYVNFGEFTGRSNNIKLKAAGGVSSKVPRYIVELVTYRPLVSANGQPAEAGPSQLAFLVTAVGYGISENTKVMLQSMYFKPLSTPGC
jgi:type IV pilus assembly protein PilX